MVTEKEVIQQLSEATSCVWINPRLVPYEQARGSLSISLKDIKEASDRLKRFEPFIMKCFPETIPLHGMIESPLIPIEKTRKRLRQEGFLVPQGKLFVKQDSDLAIAGSVKARGGVYEVLKHAEDIALDNQLITLDSDYGELTKYRDIFSKYKIQVGSTGNLGMSIGIIGAAIGFNVTVHMSSDAKQWKKEKLRQNGVHVIEYESDYSCAVAQGREASKGDPTCYFVDDEKSLDLFMGYSVAAERLKKQLEEEKIIVNQNHPLFVYLPCGVGGAPGGITFGLKEQFGDAVHCFFQEPVQCPCMTLGLASGMHEKIRVEDIGLTGKTEADGLAVSCPSSLVSSVMDKILSGTMTIEDASLFDYMRILEQENGIFIEPSSCASIGGYLAMGKDKNLKEYLELHGLTQEMPEATHIVWATGGSMVPEYMREEYRNTYLCPVPKM